MTFHLASRKIIKDWTDYNEHMNMAYYVLIFDEAWETMLGEYQWRKFARMTKQFPERSYGRFFPVAFFEAVAANRD